MATESLFPRADSQTHISVIWKNVMADRLVSYIGKLPPKTKCQSFSDAELNSLAWRWI